MPETREPSTEAPQEARDTDEEREHTLDEEIAALGDRFPKIAEHLKKTLKFFR